MLGQSIREFGAITAAPALRSEMADAMLPLLKDPKIARELEQMVQLAVASERKKMQQEMQKMQQRMQQRMVRMMQQMTQQNMQHPRQTRGLQGQPQGGTSPPAPSSPRAEPSPSPKASHPQAPANEADRAPERP